MAFASPLLPVSEEGTFLRLFDAARVALALVDDARRITRVNAAWVDLLGYSADEALRMELDDVVDGGGEAAVPPDIRVSGTGSTRTRVVRADGHALEVRYGALGSIIKGAHLVVLAPEEQPSAGEPARAPGGTGKLTGRERDSLRLVAQGMTTALAASRLGISPETVRTHVRNAMNKLGAKTRAQAIAIALRDGEISE